MMKIIIICMIYLLMVVNGEFQNHYEILQIDEKATANEIKKAYRKNDITISSR